MGRITVAVSQRAKNAFGLYFSLLEWLTHNPSTTPSLIVILLASSKKKFTAVSYTHTVKQACNFKRSFTQNANLFLLCLVEDLSTIWFSSYLCLSFRLAILNKVHWRFCPRLPLSKGITIVFHLFRTNSLAAGWHNVLSFVSNLSLCPGIQGQNHVDNARLTAFFVIICQSNT